MLRGMATGLTLEPPFGTNICFLCVSQVEYDFKYYKMEMTTDVQLLVLSEGKSNILPADLVLPFRPISVGSPEMVDARSTESLEMVLG